MNANIIAADIGCLFVTKNKGIRIGMSISNFGSKMKLDGYDTERDFDVDETIFGNNDKIDSHLDTQGWPLPLIFRAGISKDIIDDKIHKLTLAGDAIHPNNNRPLPNLYYSHKAEKINLWTSKVLIKKQKSCRELRVNAAIGFRTLSSMF